MYQSPHGGDILSAQARLGRPVLDFSANLNPLGMPPGVRQAVLDSALDWERYPDPYCRQLRAAIAGLEGVPPQWIQCGNGAADLIYRLCYTLRPKTALVLAPTFSEYEQAIRAAGGEVRYHMLRPQEDFRLGEDLLAAIAPPVELVCLCNPNNPTGQLADPALLRRVIFHCKAQGIPLLLDECFVDFVAQPAAHTQAGLLGQWGGLVILRAFTKLYAMAGLRLGYCLCSDGSLLDRMAHSSQAWGVSAPAQAAGVQAVGEEDFRRRTAQFFLRERPRMAQALTGLGLGVMGSQANYLFFHSPRTDLADRLEEEGLLLRRCENYRGLSAHYYRAAIRTPAENDRLLAALRAVLQGAGATGSSDGTVVNLP